MRQFLCFGANEIASTFSFIQTKIFLNPVLRCCLKGTYATRPPGLESGSNMPRFDANLEKGKYINPFTGEVGGPEVGKHIPLDIEYY